VEPRPTDTRLIWTPGYNGRFRLSGRKRSSYIFSKINQLDMDTRLTRTLWHVLLVSVLTGFRCIVVLFIQYISIFSKMCLNLNLQAVCKVFTFMLPFGWSSAVSGRKGMVTLAEVLEIWSSPLEWYFCYSCHVFWDLLPFSPELPRATVPSVATFMLISIH